MNEVELEDRLRKLRKAANMLVYNPKGNPGIVTVAQVLTSLLDYLNLEIKHFPKSSSHTGIVSKEELK